MSARTERAGAPAPQHQPPPMSGRLERKIVVALLGLALIPMVAGAFLVDRVMDASEAMGAGEADRRRDALESARRAYIELFTAEKARLRERGADVARRAPIEQGALEPFLRRELEADPSLEAVRVAGDPPLELRSARAYPEAEFRELQVAAPSHQRPIELTYVTARRPFVEFDALDKLQAGEFGLGILHQRLGGIYRTVFLLGLALVIAAALAIGFILARRITGPVLALSQATKRVAAGDLEARVDPRGKDELAALGRAFNQMVAELQVSRERIAYLQKISAWQEIARRLAHEIKNPLTPIQLAVQQLETSYTPRGDGDRYGKVLGEAASIVREEIAGLRRLVEEFSAFAKLPRAELQPVDAGALVEDLLRSYSGFDGKVELAPPSGPVPIRADKLLLRRALHNLIENALQAGASRVWLTVARAGSSVTIVVDDDGPGVPAELQQRVFDPYVTTKEHGTGLGLAIVRKIVLEHGGEVTLGDRPGGGARLTVTLPAPP